MQKNGLLHVFPLVREAPPGVSLILFFCRAVPLRIYEVSSGFEYLRKEKMQEHVSQRDPSI